MKYVKCPLCGSKMNLRSGRFGSFYGCGSYPKCTKIIKISDAVRCMVNETDHVDDDLDTVSKAIAGSKTVRVSKESPMTILPESGLPTSVFPLLKFKFSEFTPEQVESMKYYDKDCNFVLALPTGSGKTSSAEMFMAHSLRQGKKVAYISPLKALAQEKYDDWSGDSHEWSKKKNAILTGDYTLSSEKVKWLNDADIILLTSEMLCSRVRKRESEKSEFLDKLGTLIIDESHLLASSRGPTIECGLMKFTKINPDCRIVFLSATMPNVIDMCGWLTKLNGKKTEMINTDQRPVPLEVHWVTYDDRGRASEVSDAKIEASIGIVDEFPDDNFILFVHSKAIGRKLRDKLRERGYEAEFHCADLSKDDRGRIERAFRSKELRVLVATSTISMGLNI